MESVTSRSEGVGEWRRGWPLVAAGMIGIGTGPGLFQNLSSLFIPGMIADFGWTRGDVATAAGIGLLGGFAAPLLGRLTDRIGVRPMIAGCMLLLGLAYVGLAAMSGQLWEYRLLVLALALSVPGTSALVYGKLVSSRFVVHRGIALGVATLGLSITTLVMPPIVGVGIARFGWRGGFVMLAILTALIALPLVLVAIRGRTRVPTRPDPDSAAAGTPVAGFTGAEARRDGRFWRLGIAIALINIGTIGLVTQLVPFGLDHGLTAGEAALLLASYGASQVAGRLLMGFLVDRYRAQAMAAGIAVFSAVAFVGLQIDQPGFPLMMALIFGAGLMNGAEHDLLPYLAARLFGLRAYGEVYGSLLAIALIGTATGIVGFGRLYDIYQGYGVALGIASFGLLGAAGLFLSLKDKLLPVAAQAARSAMPV